MVQITNLEEILSAHPFTAGMDHDALETIVG